MVRLRWAVAHRPYPFVLSITFILIHSLATRIDVTQHIDGGSFNSPQHSQAPSTWEMVLLPFNCEGCERRENKDIVVLRSYTRMAQFLHTH
ncbi:hypothetical protein BXZ70DRAFT_12699 [Cristinia sonorae]|uniref:Secreted protein n=1 Tax=Cristinia sonorae TaxID=1940300 RepID=A0A8K0V1F8_9AGAR|nr:hypothetical protein BXZ70DRAFT_12699 [Cristinia sonorae]